MYAYRPQAPRRGAGGSRYFSAVDRFMVLVGVAAALGFVGTAIAQHGATVLTFLHHAFGQ